MLKALLKYRKNAVNAHGIHSPFVFEFFNEVIKKSKLVDDSDIVALRKKLLRQNDKVEVKDLGAGSRVNKSTVKSIAQLTRNAAVSRKYGQLLSQIVDYYELKKCLELGTSMGLGTAYLAKKSTSVLTIEGCPQTYQTAKNNFEFLNCSNIEAVNAEFRSVIDGLVRDNQTFDLMYIDGNHRYEPTLEYFNRLIELAHNDTFIIFDDIHWSNEMEKAWQEIVSSDKINVSIELFRMGIVLKRSEQTKQHFVLKF